MTSSNVISDDQLSDEQQRNINLLKENLGEIVADVNRQLNEKGIPLYVDQISLSANEKSVDKYKNPVCCSNGQYVAEAWLCEYIEQRGVVPGGR